MPSYRVSETAFYAAVAQIPQSPPAVPRIDAAVSQITKAQAAAPRMQAAIAQIAQRYDIKDKSVLSLGGGFGMEEYYFTQHGNRLTIVDIDEFGFVEPILKSCPAGDLNYVVGDANGVEFDQPFDALFLSGFTPDELRRSEIVRQRDTETFRRMVELNDGAWEWPWWEDPFHALVMRFARNLREGGTMIVQSYCGSLDMIDHRYYLWACDRQLAEAGMRLLELYRFAQTTGSMLYVTARGSPAWPLWPPITCFHGRAEPERVQCLRLAAPPDQRSRIVDRSHLARAR
jgi:hypothetical protein